MGEIENLRRDVDELRKENNKYQRENLDQKEQIRTLNDNLKREAEISKSRESESRVFGQENRTLKKLLEDSKEDYSSHKQDQNRLIQNLRLQLDETKDMIDKIRETKDREMKRIRDKFDEEKRKECEKYQFEYDKLREEIQLFARKLGQEENLNKQLSMLNYKLQNNLTDLGKNYGRDDVDLYDKKSIFYPSAMDIDNDTNDQLYQRKKAWADLEREQDEVKGNIKTLMRRAPESNEIDNPLLAERVSSKSGPSNYKVPQDVILEQKHKKEMGEARPATTTSNYKQEERGRLQKKNTEEIKRESSADIYRSKEKLPKDKSNEDLSLSSQSKMQQTHKRQWKAPNVQPVAMEEKQSYQTEPKASAFDKQTSEVKTTTFGGVQSNNSSLSPDTRGKTEVDSKPKGLFGGKKDKKNVFNPFAKKSSPAPSLSKVDASKPSEGLSFGEAKNSSSDFENKMKPVNLNNTGSVFSGDQPSKIETKPKSEDEIDEAISDNYEEDFEDASAGQTPNKGEDDFFKEDKKNIDKQSDPSQNSGLPFNDDYDDADFF